jgi:hypothetical protein
MPEELRRAKTTPETYQRLIKLGWYHNGRSTTWKYWWNEAQRTNNFYED